MLKEVKKAPWSNYNGIKTLFPFANASHLLQIEFQSLFGLSKGGSWSAKCELTG